MSKPIGTGAIFAAEGLGEARGLWVQKALETMLQSNADAADIFAGNCARSLTDVTGFGLLGHLLEMLGGEQPLGATLIADRLPLIPGAGFCAEHGWLSSLQPQNAAAYSTIDNPREWRKLPHWELLVDPQTSGGLLAAVPAQNAEDCLRALQQAGSTQAAIIGRVHGVDNAQKPIRLLRSGDWQQLTVPETEAAQSQI